MSHRLAIVLTHATQYYSPWFRFLAQTIPAATMTFRVFYLSEDNQRPTHDEKFGQTFAWDSDLLSGYAYENVPNTAERPSTLRRDGIRNPALPGRLAAFAPTAILIFGYNYHTHLHLIGWAKLRGIPLIFRGDSHLLGRPLPGGLKRFSLACLYAQFSAFACVGEANRDYFLHFGVPPERLYFSPHSVNHALFKPQAVETFSAKSAELHQKLHLAPYRHILLFAGKFIPQKQPELLLSAYLSLPADQLKSTALLFVGDGPLKPELKSIASLRPDLPIHFLPFSNQSQMPALYALADIVILPSIGAYETWGLVVNEAMHMGRPCIVSDHVGCQRDLVTHGETGWVFEAASPIALTRAISAAIHQLTPDRAALRSTVLARIARYTYEETSRGLLRALSTLPSATPIL